MCTKFRSVGFLPSMVMSLVRQEPALIPVRKKKKIKAEKVICNDTNLVFVFSYFEIAVAV